MAYIDFHPTIHAMGDEACAAALIEGTIIEFEDLSLDNVAHSGFRDCKVLQRVSLPAQRLDSVYSFGSTESLEEFTSPRLQAVTTYSFNGSGVYTVDLAVANVINTTAFRSCGNLSTLILRNLRVVNLTNVSAFTGTPIEAGTGYIYVPKKMLDGSDGIAAYSSATNWSTYAGQFRYIEDYPDITGG